MLTFTFVFFNEVYRRGYKMLYMTARAIGQYGQTKRFLRKEVEESIFDPMQTGSIFLLGRSS